MDTTHVPQRMEGESFGAYKGRRRASHRAVSRVLAGAVLDRYVGHSRRPAIKAAGGIRQFKRQRYLAEHEGYALRHPGMARG